MTCVIYPATDLDECSSNPGCDHYCENTEGSYRCSCRTLYTLNSNGHTCDGSVSYTAVAGSIGGLIIILILGITIGVCIYKCRAAKNKPIDFDDPNPL